MMRSCCTLLKDFILMLSQLSGAEHSQLQHNHWDINHDHHQIWLSSSFYSVLKNPPIPTHQPWKKTQRWVQPVRRSRTKSFSASTLPSLHQALQRVISGDSQRCPLELVAQVSIHNPSVNSCSPALGSVNTFCWHNTEDQGQKLSVNTARESWTLEESTFLFMGFSPMHCKSLPLRAPPFSPLNHISCRTQESQEILPGTHHTWINLAPHGEAHFSTEPLEPHGIIFSGEGTQHLLYPIQTSFPAPTKTKEFSG